MYYTDDALYPENQQPLIITACPYGPAWLPSDFPEDIPVTWDQQVQAAKDCYNAGATVLHIHVRNPATGKGSKDFEQFNYLIGLLKQAVPEMILQVGGSISFAPKGDEKAKWLDYDTRHMLADLDPAPEQVTIAVGTGMMDVVQMWTEDDIQGTALMDPEIAAEWAGLWADAGPGFYIEHLKRLRAKGIQPYFMLGYIHQLEIVERLIRAGLYAGPVNHCLVAIGGGCAGRNPFDWMEYLRRSPQGSLLTWENTMRGTIPMTAMAVMLGIHVRVGNEDNIWRVKGERFGTVQQIEQMVKLSEAYGRPVATAAQAREMSNIGVWYDSADETLFKLGLPPNRPDGKQGFVTWETTGRHGVGAEASDSHPMAYCLVGPSSVDIDVPEGVDEGVVIGTTDRHRLGGDRMAVESGPPRAPQGRGQLSTAGPDTAPTVGHQPAAGEWDERALHQLTAWDPDWAAAYERVVTNPWTGDVLPPKMLELISVGLNAACTALQAAGTRRHIRAALTAGASRDEILTVLKMASMLSIHSCSLGAPLLLEEVQATDWQPADRKESVETPACDAMRAMGQWNAAWDPFFALDPVWTDEFMAAGLGIYAGGVLTAKEVELLSIAFDASVTHMYAPGTHRHIKGALAAGATVAEIMEVLKVCVAFGGEALQLGVPILAEELARNEH